MALINEFEQFNLLKKLAYNDGITSEKVGYKTPQMVDFKLNYQYQPSNSKRINDVLRPRQIPTNFQQIEFDVKQQAKRKPNFDLTKKLLKQKVNFANEKGSNKYPTSGPYSTKNSNTINMPFSPLGNNPSNK